MNVSILPALAALAGTFIGGLTSVFGAWLAQRTQAREQWMAQDHFRREELYKEFIEDASRCYMDALQHHEPDIPALVSLYAKMSRMRVLSTPEVVAEAELVGQIIVDGYLSPDIGFVELKAMIADGSIEILGPFSRACRMEFEKTGAWRK
ncbi:hypothetical protein AU476_28775 [Cupriavidus sp. UYMSc13B]|nr:hypothetical protein AU476_28775 [Cupriavidus sp. UYMSc13B]